MFLLSESAPAYQSVEVILPSSQPAYFQGEELPRTSSPFGLYYAMKENIRKTLFDFFYANDESDKLVIQSRPN